jgi:hypothetical protein
MKSEPAFQKALEQHVARCVLPAVGCPQAGFTLTATGLGINSDVFFLDIAGHPPLVLKAIRPAGRFSNLLRCSALLAGHGLKVPRIIYARRAPRLFSRLGRHVICEERIMGPTLAERRGSGTLIGEAARLLSRLHRIRRIGWGTPEECRTHGLYRFLGSKLQDRLRQWRGHDPDLSDSLYNSVPAWIQPWEHEIEQISTFSLSHGDPNPGNLILGPQQELYLLDIGHIRYLPAALDFFTLQLNLCEDDERTTAAFEAAYMEEAPPQDSAAFAATRPFFKACVLVNFGCMLAERLAEGSLPEPLAAAGRRHLQAAARLLADAVRG